ncbi:MAG: M3 family oligoendopeptidase [Firmicutes bacterium]|nr:M3 family oligoendopeptidase [Bacillota bacterium]
MKKIKAKIGDLTSIYCEQLQLYEKIKEKGSQERALIKEGRLDQLLKGLQERQSQIAATAGMETKAAELQGSLLAHFQIEEFSLLQLKQAAPADYKEDLESLEAVISKLVPLLEELEAQEKENEALLKEYLNRMQALKKDRSRFRRAAQAYGSKDSE